MRFDIRMTREVTEYVDVTIDAKDAEEAEDKAYELEREGELEWEHATGNDYVARIIDLEVMT